MDLAGLITEKPDLDLWYHPQYDNYFKLIDALEELGQNVSKFREEQIPNPKKSFFRYQFDDLTLDLLPSLKAPLKFRDSFEKRDVVNIKGLQLPFINLEDLLEDKKATSRPKDLEDIE